MHIFVSTSHGYLTKSLKLNQLNLQKECERYALALGKEDFTDDVEKDLITQVYNNAIDSLGEDDRKLPQVEALLPLLKRGIGIHHVSLYRICFYEVIELFVRNAHFSLLLSSLYREDCYLF